MEKISYGEAVEFAKRLRAKNKETWLSKDFLKPLERSALEFLWSGGPDQKKTSDIRNNLLEMANSNANYRQLLLNKIAETLKKREPFPEEIHYWLIAFLRNPQRPKMKAGRPSNSVRDEIIYFTIKCLCEKGLIPTANQATQTEKSACHAVAKEWNLSYAAIVTIYNKCKKNIS
jgi:hypothetical protein